MVTLDSQYSDCRTSMWKIGSEWPPMKTYYAALESPDREDFENIWLCRVWTKNGWAVTHGQLKRPSAEMYWDSVLGTMYRTTGTTVNMYSSIGIPYQNGGGRWILYVGIPIRWRSLTPVVVTSPPCDCDWDKIQGTADNPAKTRCKSSTNRQDIANPNFVDNLCWNTCTEKFRIERIMWIPVMNPDLIMQSIHDSSFDTEFQYSLMNKMVLSVH